jgi:hypothetical protein
MPNMNEADPLAKIAPGEDIVPVVPSDTVDFAEGPCRQLRCTATGTFVGLTRAGHTRTVTMFYQGEHLPVSFKRINATGTTGSYEAIY